MPPGGLANPVFAYAHSGGCASITGGAFVPQGVWPAAYGGRYLFSDYVCGTIFQLTEQSNGTFARTTFATGLGTSSAVAMTFGPHLGSQALYYTTYAAGGQVRRIAHVTNRAPVVSAVASPRSGVLPLTVRFDASASRDPDGDALTFRWNFADGTPAGSGAVVTHVYSTAGAFNATVTVTDSRGSSATAAVTIHAGNRAPQPAITAPSSAARFSVGEPITLRGTATDPEDGALPGTSLSWRVIMHHSSHTHPLEGPATGASFTFRAPPPEDLAATTTSHVEIRADGTGLPRAHVGGVAGPAATSRHRDACQPAVRPDADGERHNRDNARAGDLLAELHAACYRAGPDRFGRPAVGLRYMVRRWRLQSHHSDPGSGCRLYGFVRARSPALRERRHMGPRRHVRLGELRYATDH